MHACMHLACTVGPAQAVAQLFDIGIHLFQLQKAMVFVCLLVIFITMIIKIIVILITEIIIFIIKINLNLIP